MAISDPSIWLPRIDYGGGSGGRRGPGAGGSSIVMVS
jgi:hypothetical protein